MPTYEYGCEACGKGWELQQRITADPGKKCPHCGKMKARRLISSGNFILKGGGWYADLYSKPAPSGDKKDKTADAGSPEAGAAEAPAADKAGADKKAGKSKGHADGKAGGGKGAGSGAAKKAAGT